MFHFPPCRSAGTISVHPGAAPLSGRRVPPFGNLRIKALWRLPEACRSLMRPSSPHDAKASVARPYTLSKKLSRISLRCISLQLPACVFQRSKKTVPRPLRGSGGGSRIRTGGILLAKQALYQLSYTPARQMHCLIVGLFDCLIA